MLTFSVYAVALGAGFAIVGLSLATLAKPRFRFWPPPSPESWQHTSFRWLFRLFFLGLVALSFVEMDNPAAWRYVVGMPLLVIGFGLALYWTNFLGWRNAFGEACGLKIDGAYGWSRNPIYVVSIIGMIGWGVIVSSWWVISLLLLWAMFYVVAPFLEEPWLEQQYGNDFLLYRSRVPRFFGRLSRQ